MCTIDFRFVCVWQHSKSLHWLLSLFLTLKSVNCLKNKQHAQQGCCHACLPEHDFSLGLSHSPSWLFSLTRPKNSSGSGGGGGSITALWHSGKQREIVVRDKTIQFVHHLFASARCSILTKGGPLLFLLSSLLGLSPSLAYESALCTMRRARFKPSSLLKSK